MNVRHILIEPEADEDGTITDEAWTAAEEKAQEVLTEWQSGAADEESFGELANTYSTDTGSNSNGGLYEDVHPGPDGYGSPTTGASTPAESPAIPALSRPAMAIT